MSVRARPTDRLQDNPLGRQPVCIGSDLARAPTQTLTVSTNKMVDRQRLPQSSLPVCERSQVRASSWSLAASLSPWIWRSVGYGWVTKRVFQRFPEAQTARSGHYSVGRENCTDNAEVAGSTPASPTKSLVEGHFSSRDERSKAVLRSPLVVSGSRMGHGIVVAL